MDVTALTPGDTAVLPDGSIVTRRFNGGFRVRGLDENPDEPGVQIEARFDPDQPRDDEGRWTDTPDSGSTGAADRLNLGRRIQLSKGETLAGSAAVRADEGTTIPMAVVNTPTGTRLRIGVGIDSTDERHWAAANRGYTANLDSDAAGELQEALQDIVQVGQLADSRRAELETRADDLHRRQRDLFRSQFSLTRAQARELDRLDDEIADHESRVDLLQGRVAERVGRMPPEFQARYRQAGTLAEQKQVLREWHHAQPEWRGVGVETLHGRDVSQLADLQAQLRTMRARRTELTSNGRPLSDADAAELARLEAQAAQAEQRLLDFSDGGLLSEGTIRGQWGDITYRITMEEFGVSYGLSVDSPGTPEGLAQSKLTAGELQQLSGTIGDLLGRPVQAANVEGDTVVTLDHLEGLTLGDSEVDLDLWDDGSVTLGWDDYQTRLAQPDTDDLVAALNQVRGGEAATAQVDNGRGAILTVARAPGGDVRLAVQDGPGPVLLSDADAYDLQLGIVDWFPPEQEVQARRFDPGKHPRWPKGTPGGLGGRFMPKDLVPRSAGDGESRSTRRSSPPPRSRSSTSQTPTRRRSLATSPGQVATVNRLTQLDQAVRQIPAATRGSRGRRSVSGEIRDMRSAVDAGELGPDEAAGRLETLAERPDVAADSRLEDLVFRAVNDLRGQDDEPPTPDGPVDSRQRPTDPGPGIPEELRPATPQAVDRQVADVIRDLTPTGDNPYVPLADLRERLSGLSREQQDEAIRRLARPGPDGQRAIMLIPESNQKVLSPRDREARLVFGNQPKDYIWPNAAVLAQRLRAMQAAAPTPIADVRAQSDRPLRNYWLRGEGALKIRWGAPGDFTRCVRNLREHVRDPEGLCAEYHFAANGFWPGDRRNLTRASADTEEGMILPNPNPTVIHAAAQVSVDDVRAAFYAQAPQQAWIREFHTEPKQLIVANDADGSVARVDFEITDDGAISFSQPVPVRVEYVENSDADKVAASRMVYASRAESRPAPPGQSPLPPGFEPANVAAATVSDRPWSGFDAADYTPAQWRRACLLDRGPDAGDEDTKERYAIPVREPDGTLNRNGVHAAAGGHGIGAVEGISDELRRSTARKIVRLYRDELDETPPDSLLRLAGMSTEAAADPPKPPAAEPEQPTTEEDDMSLTEVRQRLGLADDADEAAILAAVDELKTKADTAPDPQQVAAAAATEQQNKDLTKQVQLLDQQVQDLSAQVSAAAAEKASSVKATVLDGAQNEGKFAPADRQRWENDYDEAPEVVTRVLASIAPGTAVPVNLSGKVGDPKDVTAAEDLPPEPDWLFSNPNPAMAGVGTSEKEN